MLFQYAVKTNEYYTKFINIAEISYQKKLKISQPK